MQFKKVRFKNFRNLSESVLNLSSNLVFLTGSNAQGKTNFLEALYFLCYGSSFRTRNLKDIVRHGENSFFLEGEFEDINGLDRKVKVQYEEGKKTVFLDGREVKDRKEVLYNIPCVIFSWEDMSLVSGDPSCRRNFFDQSLSMFDPLYLDDLRRYKMILKHRNAAIKSGLIELMGTYDALLSRYGTRIQSAREQACSAFNLIFPELYSKVASDGLKVRIKYLPSWGNLNSEAEVQQYLKDNCQRDIKMATTSSGVHRDRFLISGPSGLLKDSSSTGEMRLASLALRASQASYFKSKTGKDPIMLIDDVMLELDSQRRAKFLSLELCSSQSFFTFLTDEKYFSDKACPLFLRYEVKNGTFEACQ